MNLRPGGARPVRRAWSRSGRRTGHRVPFGLPETVLALVLLVTEFVLASEPVTVVSVLCAVAGAVLVAVSPRWPVPAAVLTVPFAVVSSYIAGDAPTYAVFFVLLVIEVVTAAGPAVVGLLLVVLHTVMSLFDFTDGHFDTDPVVLTVTLVLLATGYLVGRNRLSQALADAALRRSLADSQRLQRLSLARELHDSVATSLTGVVMRAQALELTLPEEEDPTVVQGLQDISRTSRTALEQLRTMLRLLNSEDYTGDADDRGPVPSLRESLGTAGRELRAHGLKVRTRVTLPRGTEPAVDLRALSRILTEMTANAAKHSPSRSEVTVACRTDGTSVTVTMVNPVAGPGPGDPALTSHLGMGSMAARARAAGGALESGPLPVEPGDAGDTEDAGEAGKTGPRLWRTTVTLPIVDSVG